MIGIYVWECSTLKNIRRKAASHPKEELFGKGGKARAQEMTVMLHARLQAPGEPRAYFWTLAPACDIPGVFTCGASARVCMNKSLVSLCLRDCLFVSVWICVYLPASVCVCVFAWVHCAYVFVCKCIFICVCVCARTMSYAFRLSVREWQEKRVLACEFTVNLSYPHLIPWPILHPQQCSCI